jgi:hypothetical protein
MNAPIVTKVLGGMLALGLFALLGEGAASWIATWRRFGPATEIPETRHATHDAELGWRQSKSFRIAGLYGAGTILTTNSLGFRGTEEITPRVPADRYRITCLGDSFTMGFGVDDQYCYPAQMEAVCPTVQTVNMGMAAYGIDQCWLWYRRDGVHLDTDLLLFAVIDNDFDRMSTDRFLQRYPKPVLTLEDGEPVAANLPVPEEFARAPFGRRVHNFLLNTASARLLETLAGSRRPSAPPSAPAVPCADLARAVIADLDRLSRERGQAFAVVHLPTLRSPKPNPIAEWLDRTAAEIGVPYLDLAEDFGPLTPAELRRMYRSDGHYSPAGYRLVAEVLLEWLRAEVPGFPDVD